MNKYFLLFAGLMASMTGFAQEQEEILQNEALPETEAVVVLPDADQAEEDEATDVR